MKEEPQNDQGDAQEGGGLTRRRLIRLGVYGGLGLAGAGYAAWSSTLGVSTTAVARFGLARRLRVAVISDLHAPHFWFDPASLRAAVNAADPDVIVVLGDVIDAPEALPLVGDLLAGLKAPHKVAILGNWEYWGDVPIKALRRAYADVGVELLVNASRVVEHEGGEVVLVGLDDLLGGMPALGRVEQERRDRPVIVFSHCPKSADAIAARAKGPTLVLSGHTHGGQVAPFGLAVWTPPGSGDYVSGLYRPGDGGLCDLYVSKGLGCSLVTLRLGPRSTLDLIDVS